MKKFITYLAVYNRLELVPCGFSRDTYVLHLLSGCRYALEIYAAEHESDEWDRERERKIEGEDRREKERMRDESEREREGGKKRERGRKRIVVTEEEKELLALTCSAASRRETSWE